MNKITTIITAILIAFLLPANTVQAKKTDKETYLKYARWFADSEMKRFPEAWQLDHGKRLFFG